MNSDSLSIADLVVKAHSTAAEKGFWEPLPSGIRTVLSQKLVLIHSEVSEALEELRKRDWDARSFGEELADIVIRVGDVAGYLGLDLEEIVQRKLEANRERPRKHGKAF